MRKLCEKITDELAGLSVESGLKRCFFMSNDHISRLKRRPEGITLNGKKAYTTATLSAGDMLCAEICDGETVRPTPMDMPLVVLYEDEDIIIIDKPAGVAVHSSTRNPEELTLENAFSARLKEGENFPVDIEIKGEPLSDHFDPGKDIVSISKASLEDSVSTVAVVAHEFGHVQQKFNNSLLFNIRTGLVPVVNIGSRIGYILIIAGLILNILNLAEIGLILFALTTVFALITLPIEIDASKKAFKLIRKYNLISESRIGGAKSVLNAAATTYIASLLTSFLNLMYYASLINRRR